MKNTLEFLKNLRVASKRGPETFDQQFKIKSKKCLYCGSLASVRSHKPASPSRVSASRSASLHMLFFWLKSASTGLRACCQLFDCLCEPTTSFSIGAVGNCLVVLLVGFALKPACVPSYSVPVIPTRESTPHLEPGNCGCGLCVCGEPSASQSQCSETASEGLFNLAVGPVIGACMTPCCAQRGISQEIIVAAEELRSFP